MIRSLFKRKKPKQKSPNTTWVIKKIIEETPDTRTFILSPHAPVNYNPGQFLSFTFEIDGSSHTRAYSLCSSPYIDEPLAVTVKRVEQGLVSNYMNTQLKEQDLVQIQPPQGRFTPDLSNQTNSYVLFAGGSGITPIFSILKSIMKQKPHAVIHLFYANKNVQSIIFKDQLDLLEQTNKNLQVQHYLDVSTGSLLTTETINQYIQTLPINLESSEYFICGPTGMIECVEASLHAHSLEPNQIKKELFVNDKIELHSDQPASDQTAKIKIEYLQEIHTFDVPLNQPILTKALELGIDLPYSCQSGLCTACMGKCLSGKVAMEGQEALTDEEVENGYVLTCVGKPLSEEVHIKID